MDKKRTYKYYQLGNHVYLKVKANQSSLSLGMCSKLVPIFYGPFEILDNTGLVTYELALPTHIRVHNVFHASLLNKYVYHTKHVIHWSLLQVEPEEEVFRHGNSQETTIRDSPQSTFPTSTLTVWYRESIWFAVQLL